MKKHLVLLQSKRQMTHRDNVFTAWENAKTFYPEQAVEFIAEMNWRLRSENRTLADLGLTKRDVISALLASAHRLHGYANSDSANAPYWLRKMEEALNAAHKLQARYPLTHRGLGISPSINSLKDGQIIFA